MESNRFNKIGVLGRLGSETVAATLQRLAHWCHEQALPVTFDTALEAMLESSAMEPAPQFASREEIGFWADLIIVVGGDGTLLGAARDMAQYEKPLLGINRGRLGFLTDIMPDNMATEVGRVLQGDYVLENRFLLEAQIVREGKVVAHAMAMNDVVLHPGQSIRMIEFELHVDQQFVYSQRSDGLIISTPTGSTAYALSAGGPIMHPSLDAIVLVPMFPHTLTSRPLMIAADSEICVVISDNNDLPPHVSCDAQHHMETRNGDELVIRRHPHRLHLLHPSGHNYYETCRTKLGWGSRLGDD
ncbi:NAD(+) kinase [Salinispirillum marinum]|uniref:NAD kinase n=2 Tax=Saccharospirillaceae TaxID=255527 RepID=A0ABV8BE19_9GAMM